MVHPRNLTWNRKIMVSKRTFLFQGLIFRFHVKFRGCKRIWMFPKIVGFPPKSSILIGFSIINHPFWGYHYFWKHLYVFYSGVFSHQFWIGKFEKNIETKSFLFVFFPEKTRNMMKKQAEHKPLLTSSCPMPNMASCSRLHFGSSLEVPHFPAYGYNLMV